MYGVKLKQIAFFWLILFLVNTAAAQQFTQKAANYNIDLDGKKDGGFAFGDLNNDGFLDVIVNTEQDDEAHRTRVYFFDAATKKFIDVTSEKCAGCIADQMGNNVTERSLVIADFNNDGFKDFVKNNSKRLEVYLNNGNERGFTFGNGQNPNFFLFTEDLTNSNPPNGIPNGMNTEGIGVLDYDNDGLLDLFIENHNWGLEIYRNTGNEDNLFEYVSPEITGLPAGFGIDVNTNDGIRISGDYAAVTDYDNDGFIDIVARKSNGIAYDLMHRNPEGTGFANGQDLQDANNKNKGGVAFHDFDNDGDFDLIWTEAERTVLYKQTLNGFEEVLPENSGLDLSTANSIDGVAVGDIDNDGDLDIFLADSLGSSFLFINQLNSRDGVNTGQAMRFVQDNLGIDLQADGEGCVFTDFDKDGDLDLYVNIKNGTNQYWENNLADSGSEDYLKVDVFEDRPGLARYALGATLTLKDICGDLISGIREVNGGSGHGTQDPSEVHFALPNLNQQQYVLSVQYPVYNGERTKIEILIDQGLKTIDVFPDTESVDFSSVNFKLNYDVLNINGDEASSNLLLNDDLVYCPERSLTLLGNSNFGEANVTSEGLFTFSVLNTASAFTDTLSYEVQCATCETKTDTALVMVNFDPSNCPEIVLVNPVFKTKACLLPLKAMLSIPTCDTVAVKIESDVQNGTFTLLDNAGNFSYTLTNESFIGTDSLTYTVVCKNGDCQKSATTTIYIQVLPETATLGLTDDTSEDFGVLNTCAGKGLVFDVAGNDTISDCTSTVFSITAQPVNGTASISGTGEVTYSLITAGFVGKDTLSYSVTCESCTALTDTAQVIIDVVDGNAPIILADINLMTSCETDEVLTVSLGLEEVLLQCDSNSISITQQPVAGEVEVNENGIFSYNLLSNTFSGVDTITYEFYCASCETQQVSASVFVEVICNGICEDITVENETFQLEACGNLLNDALTEITACDSLTYAVIAAPTKGDFIFNGNDGSFTYELNDLAFNNIDSVVYEVVCVKDCGAKSTMATIYFDLTNNSLQTPVITKLVTPNGDGFNEFLRINDIECYPNHVFKVFNRWGVLVFETNDYENTPEKGWSGQINKNTSIASGSFVPDGTYFAILEFGNGNNVSEYVEIRGSNR